MAHGKEQAVFGLGRTLTNVPEGGGHTDDRGANDFEDIVDELGIDAEAVEVETYDDFDPLATSVNVYGAEIAALREAVEQLSYELDTQVRREEVYVQIVAGQDETGDTTIPVTGLEIGDRLIFVAVIATTASVATITQRAAGDFNTTADGNLTVVGNAANNTNNSYFIVWAKNRFATRDLVDAPDA